MNKALVRNTDPITSHEAASYFTDDRLSTIQADVLNWFKARPETLTSLAMRATDEDLEASVLSVKYPAATTLSKRRTDLVRLGYLRAALDRSGNVLKRKNKNNRNQIVWEVVNADSGLKSDTGSDVAMGEGQ